MGFAIVGYCLAVLYAILFWRTSDVLGFMRWVGELAGSPRSDQFESGLIPWFVRGFFLVSMILAAGMAVAATIVLSR